MVLECKKQAHENLIGQLIYIEENMPSIEEASISSGVFSSRQYARSFFKHYISRVESLLQGISVVNCGVNSPLPFIVISSRFTLQDAKGNNLYCHLAQDLFLQNADAFTNIHFLSPAGLGLLLKETGSVVSADLGRGSANYKVKSIWML